MYDCCQIDLNVMLTACLADNDRATTSQSILKRERDCKRGIITRGSISPFDSLRISLGFYISFMERFSQFTNIT